ncbi:MAG: FAD-dependent oxidoreductase [Chloroflexi bacterium]|nr:FAD-dependent oxidoreductase [Chloroflexota bacterium]
MAQRNVVVVGSGAAGMAAACAAANAGASVTVLEAGRLLGGTTAFSGGGIWIPANRWGAAEGIADSPEEGLRYLRSLGLGDSDQAVAEAFCRQGARVIEATEAATPMRWNTIEGYPDYNAENEGGKKRGRTLEIDGCDLGREILDQIRPDPFKVGITSRRENMAGIDQAEIERRREAGIEARGRGVVGALLAGAQDKGAVVRANVRATKLVTRGDAVVGVEAGGQTFEGRVVIATGGFERDPALVRAFLHAPLTAPAAAPTHVGDGLRMGMAVGAALGNMSEAWWSPAMGVPGETIDGVQLYYQIMRECAFPGGIAVDSGGRRFANETVNKSDLGRAMQAFDAGTYTFPRIPTYLVVDSARRHSQKIGPLGPEDPDPAWIFKADTIEDLARKAGLPVDALCETVERYNGHSARGIDPDFGRGSNYFSHYQTGEPDISKQLRPLSEPPFYAVRMELGCLGTKGGLKMDAHARVQRADGGGVLPGLYAAGNASANPFGFAYPGGGGTIGPAIVFGWLAGEHAAAD